MPVPSDQKILRQFLERRHPEYEEYLAHWNFLEATYHGGREWFPDNIFRYMKEGDKEYAERLKRTYRFNHTREVVDLVQKYIFKSPVIRNETDADPVVVEFWENATLSGLDVSQFMTLTSTLSSIFGRVWVFTDSTKSPDVITRSDEKRAKARAYAYFVKPQDVLDFGFDEVGGLTWILIRERWRDDGDPILSSGAVSYRYRLWQRDAWYLFDELDQGVRGKIVRLIDEGVNPLGRIPGFPVDHVLGEHRYTAPGLINDIAYLDRAVANYLSNLDAIIQDQTFSQLVMPAQGLLPGDDKYDKLLELGTKRIFAYDGEAGAKPEYISPDVKQAEIIITVVNKIIGEIYHTVGMAGERTKQDNAVGIDNSSGVAKAYDFERVNSLLAAKADSLENAENRLVDLILAWNKKAPAKEELVKYPDSFDVRNLFDEFTVAERLALVEAPEGVRREQMKLVVDKLFPRLAADLRATLEAELKSWPVDPVEREGALAEARAKAAPPPSKFDTAKKNPGTQSRQGQVTSSSK